MAFMRDPLYILMQDGTVHMHITAAESSWGVPIPQDLFDEIVMMRYYNMSEEERRAAIKRALETQFETGADGVRKASGLPTVMERVDMEVERRQTAAYGGSR
jgi:hypothetical protein